MCAHRHSHAHHTRTLVPGAPRSALCFCAAAHSWTRLPHHACFQAPFSGHCPSWRHRPCAAHPTLKSPAAHCVGGCDAGVHPLGGCQAFPRAYPLLDVMPPSGFVAKTETSESSPGERQSRSPPNSTVRTPFPAVSQRGGSHVAAASSGGQTCLLTPDRRACGLPGRGLSRRLSQMIGQQILGSSAGLQALLSTSLTKNLLESSGCRS